MKVTCPVCGVKIEREQVLFNGVKIERERVLFSVGKAGTREVLWAKVCQYARAKNKPGCLNYPMPTSVKKKDGYGLPPMLSPLTDWGRWMKDNPGVLPEPKTHKQWIADNPSTETHEDLMP
jgi:hypothetical protein